MNIKRRGNWGEEGCTHVKNTRQWKSTNLCVNNVRAHFPRKFNCLHYRTGMNGCRQRLLSSRYVHIYVACSRLSDSGEDVKVKGTCFLNPCGPDNLGAWKRMTNIFNKETTLTENDVDSQTVLSKTYNEITKLIS